MAIRIYKPTTQSRRKMSVTDFRILNNKKPEKTLLRPLKKNGGRDKTGQISVRHRGGQSKRKYRILSDLTDQMGKIAKVISLEYDPNRSSFICLVEFDNKIKSYILAWDGAKVGDEVIANAKAEVKPGNRMQLKSIPGGTSIYDIEVLPHQGGKLIKSAGSQGLFMSSDAGLAIIKMPSNEIRKINDECFASIGQVSNVTHSFVRIGKAGRNRWRGIRPSVRGKAMNPNSHPHGGGEGVNPIGLKYPKTPWGKIAIGGKTRKLHKYSDRLIVRRRK